MQATDALYYVALHINSGGGEKYVKVDENGRFNPSNKRDRNSLLTLIEQADYNLEVNRVALGAICSYFSLHYRRSQLCATLREKIRELPGFTCNTHEVALLYFMNNFQVYLNRKARPINEKDKALLSVISEVYWKYSNGHKETYFNWMTEFFVGTHKVIRDDNGVILQNLEAIERNSSHYKNGETQNHIMGSLIPEALFHEGDFAYDPATRSIVGGKYWNQLSANEQKGKLKIHAFWIQTENTPDGPNLFDLIYHRTWDFIRYLFYKHILKSERPQIGPYKKANGERGLPDHTPLFIQQQTAADRAYDIVHLVP